MLKHIGTYGKFLTLLCLFAGGFSYAQNIYVSPKACVSSATTNANGDPEGCNEGVQLFDLDPNSTSRIWNFGDFSPIIAPATRSVKYAYTTANTFRVSLIRFYGGIPQPIEFMDVKVGNYPNQDPKFEGKTQAEITVCDGKTLKLDPFKGVPSFLSTNYDYLWYPNGETTPTIDVTKNGCYSVEVFDKVSRCSKTAKINVTFCLQDPPPSGGTEKWYLGNQAQLDFELSQDEIIVDPLTIDDGPVFDDPQYENQAYAPSATAPSSSNPMNTPGAPAMVYGPDGSLKFYTDGNKVYDKDDQEIAGSPLGFANTQSQGVIIVPKPSCMECGHHKYIVVGVDPADNILKYSTIDTRLNGGKGGLENIGGVVTKIPILMPATEKINAVLNENETGWILMAQEANTNRIHTFTIDSTGITDRVVTTGIGLNNTAVSKKGSLVFNDTGLLMAQAIANSPNNFVEIYEVDKDVTVPNILTLRYTLNLSGLPGITGPATVYGVAFSSNSDYLYVTLNGSPSYLYQLNLRDFTSPAAIVANAKLISREPLSYGAMQFGPTNAEGTKYLYISVDGASYVPYLQDPDVLATGTTPATNALQLGFTFVTTVDKGGPIEGNATLGLPLVIHAKSENAGSGISASFAGNCLGSPTILSIEKVCSPLLNTITWMFEDGTEKEGETVSYVFPKEGVNKVKVKIEIKNPPPDIPNVPPAILNTLATQCDIKYLEDEIYIKPSPRFEFPDDTYICTQDGVNVTINANATGGGTPFIYNWATGTGTSLPIPPTQDFYTNSSSGVIQLEIENIYGCKTKDITNVLDKCEPLLVLPDIFTPDGDALNDDLKIVYKHLDKFELFIYNRWGELIFYTDKADVKWNGEIKNRTVSPTLYPYVIKYTSKDFPERGELSLKGTIMVVKSSN